MRVSPALAITRLAARFQERRERAAQGERPPLTEADEENIVSVAQIISSLSELLEMENIALRAGEVDTVADLYEDKTQLLKRLETRQPVIEPFLRESAEATAILRPRIQGLALRLEENGILLQSMAEASQTIRREVARVRDRHSLKGMYDKAGQSREGTAVSVKKVDTNF